MSIKYSLLALLSEGDAYGYQLRSRFESATGSVWSLNIGQVYSTLSRLERDGQVEGIGTDDDGRAMYRLTDAGRTELSHWWDSPVAHADRPRDELAIKIALALTTPQVDADAILQVQRRETIRHLQDLTRIKRQADPDDLSWRLVVESLIFGAEAEVRWLDHCEASLVRRAKARQRSVSQPSASTPDLTEGSRR